MVSISMENFDVNRLENVKSFLDKKMIDNSFKKINTLNNTKLYELKKLLKG